MEKESLFQKLKSKMILNKAKIAKRVTSLVMASAMALTLAGCGLTSCSKTDESTINPGESQTQPIDNEYSYSTLLHNLLQNQEYITLANQMKYIQPHPYTFLAKQGHDVEKLKSGKLSGKTITYVKESEPNNLYMATYVETEGSAETSGNYYTEYLLRYTLTNQELDDYYLLYHVRGTTKQYAIQLCYINDQISKDKSVTIISESKMSKIAHDSLNNKNKHPFTYELNIFNDGYKNCDFVLNHFDSKNVSLTLFTVPAISNPSITKCHVAYYPAIVAYTSGATYANGVYIEPYDSAVGLTTEGDKTFKNSIEPITLYYTGWKSSNLFSNLLNYLDDTLEN